ncbi:hypothetical protein HMPREF0872_06025 [Veillonella montpellierensis DNF00314]|uniref:CopG family transcriptional regulator n=1 Tax=Veillonella montpellierensis DNF00314 TaxID=1401067 RepID=A0A096AJL3_9FIRM|nr:hypothetical protein [Veillonella montpellierensis]KGF47055.1 hypothetical protein HMPREF0872_06025 [Veillonella montpellierensis DNF00314]
MTQSQSSESIKIYCTSQLKKQIKNIAALETKSISTYITDVLKKHFNQSIKTRQDELTTLKRDMDRIELLTLSLFKDLYLPLGKEENFEEICASVYRKD